MMSMPQTRELEAKHRYVFVHPFDDLMLMLAGTMALELLTDLEDVDKILRRIISGIGRFARC